MNSFVGEHGTSSYDAEASHDFLPAQVEISRTPGGLARRSFNAYDAIIERPLFMETRRPAPVNRVTVETREEPQEIPEVLIHGIIVSETQRRAFLKLPSSEKLLQVSEGDDLQGWLIETIEADRIVIRNGNSMAQFFMEDTIKGAGTRLRPPTTRPNARPSGPTKQRQRTRPH
ncbi:MAG: hypothetical protein H6905_02815 [Hyphomicrobiales bacterium]|nr:hypothetical protein [Hyphomicrobiales bacterium]